MGMKYSVTLSDDFVAYCNLNQLDPVAHGTKLIEKAFMEEKYGTNPEKKQLTGMSYEELVKQADEQVLKTVKRVIERKKNRSTQRI
jgi:hypothetical protein